MEWRRNSLRSTGEHVAGYIAANRDNRVGVLGSGPSTGKQAMLMLQPANFNVSGKARWWLEHSSNRATLQRTSPHHGPLRDREAPRSMNSRAERRRMQLTISSFSLV
jgi:hypothetical protein